jgi:hypothetical protein
VYECKLNKAAQLEKLTEFQPMKAASTSLRGVFPFRSRPKSRQLIAFYAIDISVFDTHRGKILDIPFYALHKRVTNR